MDSSKKFVNLSPELKANFVSKLFYWWTLPFFKYAFEKDIEMKDIYNTIEPDLAGPMADSLEKSWKVEIERAKQKNVKPSLGRAIFNTFWRSYAFYGVFVFVHGIVLRNLQSILLAEYIKYHYEIREFYEIGPWLIPYNLAGWILATTIVVSAFTGALFFNYALFCCSRVGNRARVACCSMIYRKLLKLSRNSLNQTAAGQIVNLLSNDAERISWASMFLHYIWIMPIAFIVAFYILINRVGIAAIVTLILIVIQAFPVQGYVTKQQGKFRMKIAQKTDFRVKMMSEIVSGIQVIKMYAWEKPFGKLVEISRKNEVKYITKNLYFKGILSSLSSITQKINVYIIIMVNLFLGIRPTSDVVYFMTQIISSIQSNMCALFPLALSMYAESKVTMKRFEEFLLLEENKLPTSDNVEGEEEMGLITIENASASWLPNPVVDTLIDLNLKIPPGTLCCIAGDVGSGKSSLLQMILKELPLKKGSMDLKGRISYASQDPWLFVSNIRNNILFGQPFFENRYNNVIDVCALSRDVKQFPYGDKTIVGERGVSLSGGQRARISLARAIYTEADIYLFDDPLSAVDSHVAKHLFEKCIKNYLKGKTRILATHQFQFLQQADMIIVLKNGRVDTIGTFSQLTGNVLEYLRDQEHKKDDEESNHEKIEKKRLNSSASAQSSLEETEEKEPCETQELIEKGKLSGALYMKYFRTGTHILVLIFLIFIISLTQTVNISCEMWLSYWTNLEQMSVFGYLNSSNPATSPTPKIITEQINLNFSNPTPKSIPELGINISTETIVYNNNGAPPVHWNSVIVYTVLVIASSILTSTVSFLFFTVCMNSSTELHKIMFANVLRAPMRFFDTNPSGRILSRFSRDIGAVDETLSKNMHDVIILFSIIIGILIINCIVSIWTVIPALVVGMLCYFIRMIYLKAAQNLRRLDGTSRAPIYSYVSATLDGFTTIRSSRAQDMVIQEFDNLQDQHTSISFLFSVCSTAFGFYLECVSMGFIAVVTFQFLIGNGNFTSAEVGMVISTSLHIVNSLQFAIRQAAEVSSNMTSVERLYQYIDLQTEDDQRKPSMKKPVNWPSDGKIIFKNVYLRYASDEPPVLKNLNIVIEAGEKVGIVGRTGAGKSSLILSLFRLAVIDGIIEIDDIDTSDISLEDLRSNISVIPQEPTLFSSTLRQNLDPFEKASDADIWKALGDVELKGAVENLNQTVNEGGTNFSAGQRQLICLARAILRNNKILVMDEATANVDPHTDSLVQKTIRENFKNCTVLTIAHRLNTIMDCDKVLVMDFGEMVEFAPPHELLQNPKGYFSKMVEKTGPLMAAYLRETAEKVYHEGKKTDN